MPRFYYTAQTTDGRRVSGTTVAANRGAAVLDVERSVGVPISVVPETEAPGTEPAGKDAAAPRRADDLTPPLPSAGKRPRALLAVTLLLLVAAAALAVRAVLIVNRMQTEPGRPRAAPPAARDRESPSDAAEAELLEALAQATQRTAAADGERTAEDVSGEGVRMRLLIRAVTQGDAELVDRLLAQRPQFANAADPDGRRLVHHAAQAGKHEVMAVLLLHGAEPDPVDGRGATPLLLAAVGGHAAVAEQLLMAGADTSRADAQGYTPLHHASSGTAPETAAVLLSYGANPHALSSTGVTPVDLAPKLFRAMDLTALLFPESLQAADRTQWLLTREGFLRADVQERAPGGSFRLSLAPTTDASWSQGIWHLQNGIAKYPAWLIARNVRDIGLADSIVSIRTDRPVGGVVVGHKHIIIAVGSGGHFVEEVLHHELTEIMLHVYGELFDRAAWQKSNPEGFVYRHPRAGEHVLEDPAASLETDDELVAHGFVNEYSTTNLADDVATVAMCIFLNNQWFWERTAWSEGLRQKADLLIRFYGRVDPVFTEAYFRGL